MLNNKKIIDVISAHRAPIIIALVTILCLAFFVNKAFHIDDTLFVWAAKQIQNCPADFYGFYVNWYGFDAPMFLVTQNPPIACYYIALVASLFGFGEITIHISFLVPAVAAALGTYYLAKRYCSRPVWAALAAVLTPGFLVSGTSVMCDVMMLALWVWSVFFWLRGIEKNNSPDLFYAVVLASVCALTKYFGMSLLPLLFVYAIVKKREFGRWALFLLIPILILACYQWRTYSLYGYGLLSTATAYASARFNPSQYLKLLTKMITGLTFTGGCTAVILFYIPLLWSKRTLLIVSVFTVLLIVVLRYAGLIGGQINGGEFAKWFLFVQAGLMAAAGVCILLIMIMDLWKSKNAESLLLLLWTAGTFVFAVFVNWSINARSLLPLIPAAGILLFRQIERYENIFARKIKIWQLVLPLVISAVLAICVCRADYLLANSARSAAAAISRIYKDNPRTIWFQGHWGFQYYMELCGGRAFNFRIPQLESGDIVIIPVNNTNAAYLSEDSVAFNKSLMFTKGRFLATMNIPSGAGFYTNILGPLPFAFGNVAGEEYLIYSVK